MPIMPKRSKSTNLLEFEIRFYERLLKAYPDFVDALIPLADAYTRRGDHEKGLAVDLRLTHLRGDDPLTWYNLSCSYSLLSRIDEAAQALRKALILGYSDIAHLLRDTDLNNLRQFPQFRQLLESASISTALRQTQTGQG